MLTEDKFSAYKGPLKHGTIKTLQNELLLKKFRLNQIHVDEVKNFLIFFFSLNFLDQRF